MVYSGVAERTFRIKIRLFGGKAEKRFESLCVSVLLAAGWPYRAKKALAICKCFFYVSTNF